MTDPVFYVEFATVVVLALTLWVALSLLDLNTSPQVEGYLRSRPRNPHVFDLVVANFGRGAAKNLEIELLDVDEADFASHAVQMEWRHKGPFALLGPGESITSLFGFGPSLVGSEQDPLKCFRLRVSYRWRSSWPWRINEAVDYHEMDVAPFSGIVPEWPKNDTADILKKELPKIVKAIESRPRPLLQANTGDVDSAVLGRLELLMPELFSEMREDLKKTPLCREFITMSKHALYSGGDAKPVLVYYYESHDDLTNKVDVLVNSGAVVDITYTNVRRYVMSEALVDYLAEADAA